MEIDYKNPSAIEHEDNVIGFLLTNGEETDKVLPIFERLKSEDFESVANKYAYEAMAKMFKENVPINILNLMDEVKKEPKYSQQVTTSDMMERANGVFSFSLRTAQHSVKEILKASTLRRTMNFLEEQRGLASKKPDDLEDFFSGVESGILDLSDKHRSETSYDIKSIIDEVNAQIKENKELEQLGYKTWFKIDNEIGGLLPGHTWVIGAYTGTGKTHLAVQLALNILEQGGCVAFFSTEMDRQGIYLRMLGNFAGLSPLKLLSGNLNPDEERSKELAESKLAKFQDRLFIYDDVYTVDEIRIKCKKQKLKKGLDVFFLDFVQNLRGKGNLYERMSEAAIDLQQLAKEVKSTAVLLSQVNNESQAGKGSEDVISYKGAGELAAIADYGLWLKKVKDTHNKLELTIRKSRHGTSGVYCYLDVLFTQGARMTDGARPPEKVNADDL